MEKIYGSTFFHSYHVQKFSQKDGGSHRKLIITAGHHFNKTLEWRHALCEPLQTLKSFTSDASVQSSHL